MTSPRWTVPPKCQGPCKRKLTRDAYDNRGHIPDHSDWCRDCVKDFRKKNKVQIYAKMKASFQDKDVDHFPPEHRLLCACNLLDAMQRLFDPAILTYEDGKFIATQNHEDLPGIIRWFQAEDSFDFLTYIGACAMLRLRYKFGRKLVNRAKRARVIRVNQVKRVIESGVGLIGEHNAAWMKPPKNASGRVRKVRVCFSDIRKRMVPSMDRIGQSPRQYSGPAKRVPDSKKEK